LIALFFVASHVDIDYDLVLVVEDLTVILGPQRHQFFQEHLVVDAGVGGLAIRQELEQHQREEVVLHAEDLVHFAVQRVERHVLPRLTVKLFQVRGLFAIKFAQLVEQNEDVPVEAIIYFIAQGDHLRTVGLDVLVVGGWVLKLV